MRCWLHDAHAVLVVYYVALVVDGLLAEGDAVAPVLEDEHARVYSRCACCGHVGEEIYGLVDGGVGVEVASVLHTDALQVFLEAVALEVFRTIEGEVLQEVGKSALVVILVDRTHFLGDVETCHVLGVTVVADVVGKAVGEMAYLHILVYRDGRHFLCRGSYCKKQQQEGC